MKNALVFAAALALLSAPALAQSGGGGINKDEPSGLRRGQSNDAPRAKLATTRGSMAMTRSSRSAKKKHSHRGSM